MDLEKLQQVFNYAVDFIKALVEKISAMFDSIKMKPKYEYTIEAE